jgi:hypothetical protein
MMNRDESNQIWETISGAKPLYEIYGYWPTLHDAILTNIDVQFENKIVTLTFDYNDLMALWELAWLAPISCSSSSKEAITFEIQI